MSVSRSGSTTELSEGETSLTSESREWLAARLNKNLVKPMFKPEDIIKVPRDNNQFDLYVLNTNAVLGKGSNSTIYEAYKITVDGNLDSSPPIAIKAVKSLAQANTAEIVTEDQQKERLRTVAGLQRESMTLKKMSDGLVGDHVHDEAGDYLLMPLYRGKEIGRNAAQADNLGRSGEYQLELSTEISKALLPEKIGLLYQIGNQLKKLHDKQLMHGDLHLANLLVGRGNDGKLNANIIDLDQSRAIYSKDEVRQENDINMAFFIKAPEVMQKKIGAPSDIYALGLNYLFILGHKDPYLSDAKIFSGKVSKKYAESDLFKNAIQEYKNSNQYKDDIIKYKNSEPYKDAVNALKNSPQYKNAMEEFKKSSQYVDTIDAFEKSPEYKAGLIKFVDDVSNLRTRPALDFETRVINIQRDVLIKETMTDAYLDQQSLEFREPVKIGELDTIPIEIDGMPLREIVKNFLASMLNDDPNKRPIIDEVNQFMLGVTELVNLPAEKVDNSVEAKKKWDNVLTENPDKMVEFKERILEQGKKQASQIHPQSVSSSVSSVSPIPQEDQKMFRVKLAVLLTEMKNASQQINQQKGFITRASSVLSKKNNVTQFEKNLKGMAGLYSAEHSQNPKEDYEKIMVHLINEKAALGKNVDKTSQLKILNNIIVKATAADVVESKKSLKTEFNQGVQSLARRLSK